AKIVWEQFSDGAKSDILRHRGYCLEFIRMYDPNGLKDMLLQGQKPSAESTRQVQIRAWWAEPPIRAYAQWRAGIPSMRWREFPLGKTLRQNVLQEVCRALDLVLRVHQ